jgi:hypothetical protein
LYAFGLLATKELLTPSDRFRLTSNIAGVVAAMTESELRIVNRYSATKWAKHLAVQFDLGDHRFAFDKRSYSRSCFGVYSSLAL